jgi:hypothetical protein
MLITEEVLSLINSLEHSSVDPNNIFIYAVNLLNKLGSPATDIYESLDILSSLLAPHLISESTLDGEFVLIPESCSTPKTTKAFNESVANVVRICCGKKKRTHTAIPLKFWLGKKLSIFYHPLMVGFACDSQLSQLGWGSSRVASYLAHNYLQKTKSFDFKYKNIAVILTRHRSKYAHFVRDRLTKIIWAHYLSGYGPFSHFIFDFPLTRKELECLGDLGICSDFMYASNMNRIFSIQADNILVVEVSSGMSLMPTLRDYFSSPISLEAPSKVFIRRGIGGSRRDATNEIHLEQLFKKLDYTIVDLSCKPYIDQLRYCSNASIVSGIHGAQLINSLNASALIELHSFPYCGSPWSETMLKMAQTLDMPYVPILLPTNAPSDNLTSLYQSKLSDLMGMLERNQATNIGQSAKFEVSIDRLKVSMNIAESILKEL